MVYYLEVNFICMAFLIIFLFQMRQNGNDFSADQRILRYMIWATLLFCMSDLVAGSLHGQLFVGAREILEISNLLYLEALIVISILWSFYVNVRLMPNRKWSRLQYTVYMLPAILFTALAISNPWTHLLFDINVSNLYERGPGVILHWIVTWSYFLLPTIHILMVYLKEKSSLKRHEIAPMLFFTVAPAVASIIQMLFYGITSTQVGITVSIALICISLLNGQVLTDSLTGVNNRRGFEHYLSDRIHTESDTIYMLAMIDIDNFKNINDKYGHIIGDIALKNIAMALKTACKSLTNRMFLCRFGGDEFVIFGEKNSDKEIEELRNAIDAAIKAQSDNSLPMPLAVSVGMASGTVSNDAEVTELLTYADHQMYAEKMKKQTIKKLS